MGDTKTGRLRLDCPKHGLYEAEVVRVRIGSRLQEFPMCCPECEREKMERLETDEALAAERHRLREWREMRIPENLIAADLENFVPCSGELSGHLETCRKFARNPGGRKLVMLGNNGNGKTHLAVGILKKTGGQLWTAYEIGARLRECYGGGGSEGAFLHGLCNAALLVIDEAEKAKDSEAKRQWLSHVLGKRYDARLPTVLISNCHFMRNCTEGKGAVPCPRCIEHHLERDVLSRLVERGEMLNFSGEDYRRKIRAAAKAGGGK